MSLSIYQSSTIGLNRYPFGMQIQERTYSPDSNSYRFGFNGQESDGELHGIGNSLSFSARVYNSRLCRWMSVDPVWTMYPNESPYVFVGNATINHNDPTGLYKIEITGETRKERREERKALKYIIKQHQKEVKSWSTADWRNVLNAEGYNPSGKTGEYNRKDTRAYKKLLKPGKGPSLQFSPTLIGGPADGDGIGNNRPGSAMATYQGISSNGFDEDGNGATVPVSGSITLDRGILVLYNDLTTTQHKKQPTGRFAQSRIRRRDWQNFIELETTLTNQFMTDILGHETAHHSAFMNSVIDGPPGSLFERGNMYEVAVNGWVRGHASYGYGVYKAMHIRLYQSSGTPNINNINLPQVDADLNNWLNNNYGVGGGSIFDLK